MTEFLQHLDYYLVASFKVGKQRLKNYVISKCARRLYVGTRQNQPMVCVRGLALWAVALGRAWILLGSRKNPKPRVREMLAWSVPQIGRASFKRASPSPSAWALC